MSQPIHTPGPVRLGTDYTTMARRLMSDERRIGQAWVVPKDPAKTHANARLLAGAYNAFDSAAKKLGLNAVEFAERMQDGGIAELVTALELHHAAHVAFEHGDDEQSEKNHAAAIDATGTILAKIKGGAT